MAETDETNLILECAFKIEQHVHYDLRLPERRGNGEAAPLLVALHGYSGSKKQMMREALGLAPEDFAVVSLQGVHQHLKERRAPDEPLRYGFGWLTNFRPEESTELHHRALLNVIEILAGDGSIDRSRVFLLGFSQSVALNYRFAFTYTKILRGIVGVCGGLPGDWDKSPRYKETNAAVLHLSGARDEFYPPARTNDYQNRLSMRAASVEARDYDAGHEITDRMREDVRAWLRRQCAASGDRTTKE